MDTEDMAAEIFGEACTSCGGMFIAFAREIPDPEFVLTPDQWQRCMLQNLDPVNVEKRCTELLRAILREEG